MGYFLVALSFFVLGMLCLPLALFMRAKRDGDWDDSNMTNIFRLVAHIATHPSDFPKMMYEDGRRPFWYLTKDELSDVVDTRPEPQTEPVEPLTKDDLDKEVVKIIRAIGRVNPIGSSTNYDGGGR